MTTTTAETRDTVISTRFTATEKRSQCSAKAYTETGIQSPELITTTQYRITPITGLIW